MKPIELTNCAFLFEIYSIHFYYISLLMMMVTMTEAILFLSLTCTKLGWYLMKHKLFYNVNATSNYCFLYDIEIRSLNQAKVFYNLIYRTFLVLIGMSGVSIRNVHYKPFILILCLMFFFSAVNCSS